MSSVLLEDVSIEFRVYHGSQVSLKSNLLRWGTGGIIAANSKNHMVVKALSGISLKLRSGDRLGLVGHNGSGKTTLLRTIAGIYEPVRGYLRVEGAVSALLNISLGIDLEMSGYENIFIRGLYMGISREEILDKIDQIMDFTELGDFINLPVRTYSSGMRLRLAFAVSTCTQPDILLLDELIGVGDSEFQSKAQERMNELAQRASIIVLASHQAAVIRRYCNKVALMNHGQLQMVGTPDEVLPVYQNGGKAPDKAKQAG